ncbi:MAG: hypothetical protein WDO72_20090 [Pseudomonadota bacterium]
MQSSNLAARMEDAEPDLLKLARPALQVITNPAPAPARRNGPSVSFKTRRFAIRDQGFRTFRIF